MGLELCKPVQSKGKEEESLDFYEEENLGPEDVFSPRVNSLSGDGWDGAAFMAMEVPPLFTPTICVTGATGLQGGHVLNALLSEGKFKVRATTRDPESEEAKALKEQGVEVVKADFGDLESLEAAFEGCYGAYCISVGADPKKEMLHAVLLADACRHAGLQHVIWSTTETLKRAKKFFANVPTTFAYTGLYMENFLTMVMPPEDGEDGRGYVPGLKSADAKLALVALEDHGKMMAAIFSDPETYIGKDFYSVSDLATGPEMAATLDKHIRKHENWADDQKLGWVPFDHEMFTSAGKEIADAFKHALEESTQVQDKRAHIFRKGTLTSFARVVTSFDTWVERNVDKIVLRPALGYSVPSSVSEGAETVILNSRRSTKFRACSAEPLPLQQVMERAVSPIKVPPAQTNAEPTATPPFSPLSPISPLPGREFENTSPTKEFSEETSESSTSEFYSEPIERQKDPRRNQEESKSEW